MSLFFELKSRRWKGRLVWNIHTKGGMILEDVDSFMRDLWLAYKEEQSKNKRLKEIMNKLAKELLAEGKHI